MDVVKWLNESKWSILILGVFLFFLFGSWAMQTKDENGGMDVPVVIGAFLGALILSTVFYAIYEISKAVTTFLNGHPLKK